MNSMSKIGRKIGRHHLAFYRGWLQGVDIKTLADRYLETGVDLRIAKSTLVWFKDLLTQAALRNGKRGEARLLRSHLARGDSSVATIPSIDDFREENDPDCFYTHPPLASAQHAQAREGRSCAAGRSKKGAEAPGFRAGHARRMTSWPRRRRRCDPACARPPAPGLP